jgi:hypothetical protein
MAKLPIIINNSRSYGAKKKGHRVMGDEELERRLTALDMMNAVIHVHEYHWKDGKNWSKEAQQAIEGLRISNKTQTLILYDRAINCDVRGAQ